MTHDIIMACHSLIQDAENEAVSGQSTSLEPNLTCTKRRRLDTICRRLLSCLEQSELVTAT
jgi:hypothetical protein